MKLIHDYKNGTVTEREVLVKKYGKVLVELVAETEAMEKAMEEQNNYEQLLKIALQEINEKKTLSWISEHSKPCPRCEVPIEVNLIIIHRSIQYFTLIFFRYFF